MTTRHVTIFTGKLDHPSPPPCRYSFNLTNLRDPIGQPHLKGTCTNGLDQKVIEWIRTDPKVSAVVDTIALLARLHLAAPANEPSLSVYLADRHGKWISPAVAVLAAARLDGLKLASVSMIHEGLR